MPAGGFGNLIALPLQGLARSSGNSVFIDESCSPYPDQWAFLSAIEPMARSKVEHLIEEASAYWKNSRRAYSSRRRRRRTVACPAVAPTATASNSEALPSAITVVQADQIYIPRHALPPSLIARLIRLAAFQNPEFYAAQAMRRSTHDKPRIISCAELTSHHVALPRGCFDAVLRSACVTWNCSNNRRLPLYRCADPTCLHRRTALRSRNRRSQPCCRTIPACSRQRRRSARRS